MSPEARAALQRQVSETLSVIDGGMGDRRPVRATPFAWREPTEIPPREWAYGKHYVRKYLSATFAPGGVGKSSMAIVEALAMVTGRPLLGVAPRQPLRVWLWNGEDPLEEIERRVLAACLHYEITAAQIGDRLFIDSGRDCQIVVAEETKDGATIAEPVLSELEATITLNAIDVWMFDPFISCHAVSENDNNKIQRVVKALAQLADKTNTAGELIHHVRKSSSAGRNEVTVEDGRGASALLAAVRTARALNPMTGEEATQFGVDPVRRAEYFRVSQGKANMSRATTHSAWRHMESVALGNGSAGLMQDTVGVVSTWKPDDPLAEITPAEALKVQMEIAKDEWRDDIRSAKWVGMVFGQVLDVDYRDPVIKSRIKQMVADWMKSGRLKTETRHNTVTRKDKECVIVGEWFDP